MSIILGFTGTRDGLTETQRSIVRDVIDGHTVGKIRMLNYGMCIGADDEVWGIADAAGIIITGHPSNILGMVVYRPCAFVCKPLPPLERNKNIVRSSGILLACPAGEEIQRSGTWATVRYARKMSTRAMIVMPDGQVHHEN